MYVNLVILGAFVFIYSITCGRLERTPVNGAVLFMAFGLASIVLAVMVLDKQLPGGSMIVTIVVCTIITSIIAHGLSANPLVEVLAARNKHLIEKRGAALP